MSFLNALVLSHYSFLLAIDPVSPSYSFNYFDICLGAIAGIVLFLYGVTLMSDGVRSAAGEKTKKLIGKCTSNPLLGVITGAVATLLLDSSSITIIMVIALVNAGVLSSARALGVIMGSNIGTTFSSQFIAFEIDQFAPLALLAGFLLYFIGKSKKLKRVGKITLGIGLIFFGLGQMSSAIEPLKNHDALISLLAKMESPVLGVLVGAGFTALIQSSSATLAIIITLARQDIITLAAGITLMLGAEIGTCADTLIASIGRSAEAIRAGIFHLLFNIITVFIGVFLVGELTAFVQWMSLGADTPRKIANAHMIFNVAGVLLFIGFTPYIARALEYLVPESPRPTAKVEAETA